MSPSWTEAWGLHPTEALQCGAALAATDNGVRREYVHHEETALVSPPLAASILRLTQGQELRLRLAHQGHRFVQQFTWDRAVASFESVLEEALAQTATDESTVRCTSMVL